MGNQLKTPVLASVIAAWCGVKWRGDDVLVDSIAPFSSPTDGALCFSNALPSAVCSARIALIASAEAVGIAPCLLEAEKPRLIFAKSLHEIDQRIGFKRPCFPSMVDASAKISPQSFIADGVKIGPRTVVMPFAYIGEGTIIGSDCVIKSGAVIGQDGFGFERDEGNIPLRLTHLGNVIIGNNVEIGSLTTICRGTLGNTVINDFAKIDDHVHIAHNVDVGARALVVACAEISGGVNISEDTWIGPNSSVIQKVTVGKNSLIGIGSNVTRSVPENVVVAGNPAKILRRAN